MIHQEPTLLVGVIDGVQEIHGELDGEFTDQKGGSYTGAFHAKAVGGALVLTVNDRENVSVPPFVSLAPKGQSTFLLHDVTIGVKFHWERKEVQRFPGGLRLAARSDGTLVAINEVALETYLESVISSEMSAASPQELLKAHAITSRSWLVAMLVRAETARPPAAHPEAINPADQQIIRWYSREDHDLYDVCADDHCQRYQGITKIVTPAVHAAVQATRGHFLVSEGAICDARFYKACGGLTEDFHSAWEDVQIPYLASVSDATTKFPPITSEALAREWMASSPEVFCNTSDPNLLRQILPAFDQETTDFFRWTVTYTRSELETLLLKKSGVDFGTLIDLEPLERGPSGRIVRLRISGSRRSLVVGKELEIRRWLSPSHLYSSAFVVDFERRADGIPVRITLRGAGWGHGVGLCQIGAAVMAARGYTAEKIVRHYFPGADVQALY
jgi:stage II sporulation protein D